MDNKVFAERLKKERITHKLTQRDLAELCNFDTGQVSRYEAGSREPSANALSKIAEVLRLSVDYLIGLSDEPHGKMTATDLDPRDREILDAFHRDGWPGILRLGAEKMTK